VINNSLPPPYSVNDGASLWIDKKALVTIGPLSSIGSPITFIILPKVAGPTGILIGDPVSITPYPLTSPSVASKAIVLTL